MNLLQKLKSHYYSYIENSDRPSPINLKANKISATIQKAQSNKVALHVIYNNSSFTGNLVRYDKEQGKIILKNLQSNVSAIIYLNNIDRISLVPPTLHKPQLNIKK